MTLGDAILKTPATANPAELQKTPKWNQGGLNYFVVDAGARKMLFDAGNPGGNTPKMLAKAGIAPDDIDIIFLTHMHPDHLGGLLDADGKRFFQRPRSILQKKKPNTGASLPAKANGSTWPERRLPPIRRISRSLNQTRAWTP